MTNTIYATRYALTEGIIRVEDAEIRDTMAMYGDGPRRVYLHGEGRDWHRTEEAAIKRAETMRHNKIASHHRSIAKLESLRFGRS